MAKINLKIKKPKPSGPKLKLDPKNARLHTPEGDAMIDSSLDEIGPFRSIAIDGDDIVRAGNGVFTRAKARGLKVRVVDAKPDELIAVRRKDLKGLKAQRAALYDNRAGELSAWRGDVLAGLPEKLRDGLWDVDAFSQLLTDLGQKAEAQPADAEPQIDRAAELQKKWKTERGQLWAVGEHRILCGDSTVREDVERVMGGGQVRMLWTDPPYGVGYQTKLSTEEAAARHRRRDGLVVLNDNLSESETEKLIRSALSNFANHADVGAVVYVASPAGTLLPFFISALKETGFEFKHSLVWVKDRFVMGRADYHYRHEVILYGWKDGAHYFVDDRTKDSVFEIKRPIVSEFHPTMKPIELVAAMIENSSRAGEMVGEPFAGSGTTLVACQNLGRKCRAIEISPAYTAVILERMATAFPALSISLVDKSAPAKKHRRKPTPKAA